MEHRVKVLEDKADKTDSILAEISNSLKDLVRFQVETNNNTKLIDVLFDKVDMNEKAIHRIENEIHSTCDIKSKEMNTMEKDLEDKIEVSETKSEKHVTKYFIWSMVVIAVAFSYIVKDDMNEIDRMEKIAESVDKMEASVSKLQLLMELHNHEEGISNVSDKR